MITSITRIAIILTVLLCSLNPLNAQPYKVDSTFGTNGIAIPRQFSSSAKLNQLRKVFVQPDGKILLVGSENGQSTIEIVRLNTNGTPDATFGQNGYYQANTAASNFSNAALCPDGKIAVVMAVQTQSSSYSIVYRINTDGTGDNTFGSGGAVVLTNGTYGWYSGIVIQPDGKLILGGSRWINAYNSLYGLTRLKADGSRDSTFGQNGKIENVYAHLATKSTMANNLVLQPDGKIVMAAFVPDLNGTKSGFAVIRFKSNGISDSTFGQNGCRMYEPDSVYLNPAGLMIDSAAGDVYTYGSYSPLGSNSLNYKPFLLKLTSNGTVAPGFGTNGRIEVNMTLVERLGVQGYPCSAFRQPDGKFIFSGPSDTGITCHTRVCRLDASGQMDNLFSAGGAVLDIPRNVRDMPLSCAAQRDGGILLGGFTFDKQLFNSQSRDSSRMYCIRIANKIKQQSVGQVGRATGNIYAYPNPAESSRIHLKYEGVATGSDMRLSLYDITGRIVATRSFKVSTANGEVDMVPAQSLPQGVYVLYASNGTSAFPAIKITVAR